MLSEHREPETYTAVRFKVILPSTLYQAVEYNAKRRVLIIATNAGSCFVCPTGIDNSNPLNAGVPGGITPFNTSPLIFTRVLHGSLTQDAWSVFQTSASPDLMFIAEVIDK